MKRRGKVFIALGILVLTLSVWSIGFVMGNTAASKRNNRTNLSKNVALLKVIERGDTERARGMCLTFVVGEYRFLQSKPYWISALNDQIRVDSQKYFDHVAQEAQARSGKIREELKEF